MPIADELMSGGLTLDHELFFANRPDNPEMRESTSVWLFEKNGGFSFPRFGIEAEAHSWENRLYQGNFAFADGRVLRCSARGSPHDPFGSGGRPSVLGAGPVSFAMVEPFRKWIARYDGMVASGHISEILSGNYDLSNLVPFSFEVEMDMVTPAWVQDNSPEAVAKMAQADAIEAANMGIGWRLEHQFRGRGWYELDGEKHDFAAVGTRIKRQSVRPLAGFRGHVWQAAVFPDGRAFGLCTYPPREDGHHYNEAYVFHGGKMYPAKATLIPWLQRAMAEGDDASLELEYELGVMRVAGSTLVSAFRLGDPEINDLAIQQGGARYSLDGMTTFGMLERSAPTSQVTVVK